MFIYGDDDLSNYDEITPEEKRFIIDIVNQTNFNGDKQIFITYEDVTIEIVGVDSEINKENEQDEINKGEKKDEAVKENMIADEVKIKNEFSDELEKLKKKKTDLRVRDRMARNGRPKTSKKLKKIDCWACYNSPYASEKFFLKRKFKKRKDELEFTKQVPMYPREKLKRIVKKEKDELKFTKQVPMHPGDRLKRKVKKKEKTN